MVEFGGSGRRRVLVPQALGSDEFLRVTWHEAERLVVFSHWAGGTCVAATPVRVSDVPELTELLVKTLTHAVSHPSAPQPAPAATRLSLRDRLARLVRRRGPSGANDDARAGDVVPLWWDESA